MEKIDVARDLLEELYVNKHLSAQKIATELGVSRQTIINKLREHQLEVRPKREPTKKKRKLKKIPKYKNKEEFQKAYSELKSIYLVSKKFNINIKTAYTWKQKHGIETINEISLEALWKIREDKPYCDRDLLASMYAQYSTPEIAQMWNCEASTIQKWMKRLGIETRSYEEQWNFKSKNGVRTFTPKGFDLQLYKEQIKLSDFLSKKTVIFIKEVVGSCQSCGYDETLDLHHIDEDRTNNEPENHVILCPNCHALIHRLGKTVEELCPDYESWADILERSAGSV